MSLTKLITTELRRLGSDPVALKALPTDDAGVYTITLGGVDAAPSARLAFFDADRYSVNMQMLSVASRQLPPLGNEPGAVDARLSALACGVIAQLGYLEEPLAVVERDATESQVQIRSNPPLCEDELLSYWEVTLSLGEQPSASIARYHWEPSMPERKLLPYPATFALIGRLADSLATALVSTDI
ncbi:MAG: hypothetical protein HGA19_13915 [Oscillochloris sp.]|nr:hypothetical protein [Oscillochloris sp.]